MVNLNGGLTRRVGLAQFIYLFKPTICVGGGLGMVRQTGPLNLYLSLLRRICDRWQTIWYWGGVFDGKEKFSLISPLTIYDEVGLI